MIEELLKDLRREMESTLQALRREFGRTRTGRASTGLLEGITVDYYGTKTPLNQLATLGAPEARLLVLQPYDRNVITEIERAILQSGLDLMPINDGRIIRVPIPELTEERRRNLVKLVHKVAEGYRVELRRHSRESIDLLKTMEKDKEITEDDRHRGHDKVEEITKEFIDRLDGVLKTKEQEILEV
jgi:ribosome recycling factor